MFIMNILIYLELDFGKEVQGGFHRGMLLSSWCFYENDTAVFTKHLNLRHLR